MRPVCSVYKTRIRIVVTRYQIIAPLSYRAVTQLLLFLMASFDTEGLCIYTPRLCVGTLHIWFPIWSWHLKTLVLNFHHPPSGDNSFIPHYLNFLCEMFVVSGFVNSGWSHQRGHSIGGFTLSQGSGISPLTTPRENKDAKECLERKHEAT
jgi:hypothetical protein